MSCALCHTRKEKRFCPALHDRICAQCCGEAREVTIDCPSDCVYLQQAREHEKPREADQLDPAALFAQVEVPRQFVYENEHLLVGLSFALAKAARGNRSLNDQDLIAALSAATRTYETLANSGLHYQVSPGSLGQQGVVTEVEKTLKEYREVEQKHRGFSSLRDSDVLRALVFLVRMAHARTSGRPKSRALIDSLFAQFPEKESLIESPENAPSRIIMP
ncbi:MAG TPA: hypothetical protein VJP04_01435 [Terriglobales bacterium]|nr:hypothetical protein [Terriglobales bacterium]